MCLSRSPRQLNPSDTTTQSTLHFNMTRQTHDLCKDPYYLCDPSSNKATDYCENGVCCVIIGEEHCSCERGYIGKRCDETHLEGYLSRSVSMQQFVRVMSAMSIVAVLIVVLLIILLVFFYLRAKAKAKCLEASKKALQAAPTNTAPPAVAQPGFSWREVSVKRGKSVSRTASDKRPLSLSASDITTLDLTTSTFSPAAAGPGGPGGPLSPASPARDYTQLI